MALKNFTLRIEEDLLNKLHYIAKYDDRSVNTYLISSIKKIIREFEKKHGEIRFGEEPRE